MPEATKLPLLDPDSVGVMWRELHGRVRQTVGSADRADDVVQETFLSALRRPPPDPRGLVPWLHVVARHLALRSQQRERKRGERERRAAASRPSWTSAPFGSKVDESEAEARQALRWLAVVGEPYREALRLRYLDGYEIEEIAQRLGRSQGTVRSRIKRGLDRIRQHVGGQGPRTQRVSALVFLRAWRERWGAASGPMRWAAGLAAAGTCAFVLLALAHGPGPGSLERTGPVVARAPRAAAPGVMFDWRTTHNRERALLDPWIPAEDARPSAAEAWPTDVHGVVLDVEGRVASGVAVRIGRDNGDESELAARSDALGRFRLERADGRRWVWAVGAGRLPSSRHLVASVDPDAELQLELGAPLDATLVRVSTSAGMPVSGAEITLSGPAFRAGNPEIGEQGTLELQPSPVTVVSDPDGFLRIACPPGALAHLDILALGEPPVSRSFRAPAEGEPLEVVLPAGGTLSGRVLASDGTPAAWAPLRLALPSLLPEQETRTDGVGRFLLSNVPPGQFELVLAGGPLADSSSLYVAGVMGEGEEREVELRCKPEHTLSGRAVRAEVPLEGWIVELQRLRTDLFPEQRSTRTDAQGRFAFASYASSSHYRLRLVDPSTACVVRVHKVSAGSGEVRLEPRESIGELAGLRGVLRSDDPDHPVVFAELWCDALGRRWTTLVDPSTNQFSFEDLPPLSYRLRAWMRGCGPLDLGNPELEPGEVLRIKPRIEAPGSWHLHLGLPAGVSRERVRVLVSVQSLCAANPGTQRRLELDPDNTVHARLQPGEYEYSVLIDGVLFERRSLTLTSGTRTEELEIQPFVRVTIEVRPPRLLAEREAVVALIESDRSAALRKIPLARGMNRSENRFEVFLPPDARRIRLESGQGLAGEWLASPRIEPSQLISIALVETAD